MSESKKMERNQWLFFVMTVALALPIFNVLATFFLGGSIDFDTILGRGELFIAAFVVTADAAGADLGIRQREHVSARRKAWVSRCTGICIVLAVITGILYGVIATSAKFIDPASKKVDPNLLGWLSIVTFVGVAVASYFPRLGRKS
jgi:uncharacterized membrane protein